MRKGAPGRRGRRRQRGDGLRPHRPAARRRGGVRSSTAAARTRCRPASRRSTTPRRRASSSTCSRSPGRDHRRRRTAGSPGVECVRMELGEPDESGRRRPVPIEGSEFVIDCDTVIVAIGTRANPLLTADRRPSSSSTSGATSSSTRTGGPRSPGVYAGGDIVRGAATVILAMGDGKRAAPAIERVSCAGSTRRRARWSRASRQPGSPPHTETAALAEIGPLLRSGPC